MFPMHELDKASTLLQPPAPAGQGPLATVRFVDIWMCGFVICGELEAFR